jgi:hypothetical protein
MEGIDVEKMTMEVPALNMNSGERVGGTWEETDLNIHMMTNFTDVRASINFTDKAGNLIANETYL